MLIYGNVDIISLLTIYPVRVNNGHFYIGFITVFFINITFIQDCFFIVIKGILPVAMIDHKI